jgi:2-methylcitrate dehydratase PrpD
VASALLDGQVGLAHFEDDAVRRPDVRALMGRIRMVEREGKADGMQRRSSPLELTGRDATGAVRVQISVVASPGSPDSPPTLAQIEAKVRDCLAHYRRQTGQDCDYERFQGFVDGLLAPARPLARAVRAAAGD